ncbi:hypothetical protein BGZ54_001679 [Gamsiella multidivaricata]|nr:hypothetical protein BGZ54_001679 [Gamsiella multidivaricata]
MPGVSNACINEFEQSTGHNSKLCGVQGVLIIYFTQTSSLWCSLLIYKLHLLAVWRSDFVDRHYGWLTSFCWIFPLAFAIPVAVMNLSQYPGIGFSCLVSTANLNTYLFYPLAVYIYPAMLCHTVTVAKMIHLAILSSNIDTGLSQLSSSARMKITTTMQAKRLLRGQWRPALMVGTAMTSMLIFWLFYFVDAHRLADLGPTTPWIQQWVICVMTNGAKGLTSDETQTLCSKEISSNLPSIPWLTAAELVLALVGTVVALVFISKAEFWSDWAFLLSNIFRRGKLGHGSRGHGSPDGNLPNNAEHTARYNYNGSPLKKGTRVGYNDVLPGEFKNEHNPIVRREHQEGTQWYDMDDLLDKEYDLQGAELQRNMSYGSRTAMTSACGHQSSTQLPQYPSSSIQDPHSGDILYAPPVQESVNNNAWSSAAHSAVSPAETYLVANDNSDQYVDRPVIPLPVPRAKSKASHEQSREQQQSHPPIFLSSSSHSSTFPQKSLSPMPQKAPGKTSSTSLPRPTQPDSVPIVSGVWGSPATTYAQSSATAPSPSSSTLKATLYDLNDSSDKIMVASRESVGRAPIKTRQPQKQSSSTLAGPVVDRNNSGSSRISSRSKKSNPPSALDLHAKNSPPTIPLKSPARQQFQYQQYGHQNQGVSSPTSPTSPSRQYM